MTERHKSQMVWPGHLWITRFVSRRVMGVALEVSLCVACTLISVTWAHGISNQCLDLRVVRQRVEPRHARAHDAFGASVAIWGKTAAVGAPSLGQVYVYNLIHGRWHVKQVIHAPRGYSYGSAVALSGNFMALGAEGVAGSSVYLFHRNRHRWILETVLTPPQAIGHGKFGLKIAVSPTGTEVIVSYLSVGWTRVYAYIYSRDHWNHTEIKPRHQQIDFGEDLGLLEDGNLVVSASHARRYGHGWKRWYRGQVDIFTRIHGHWGFTSRLRLKNQVRGEHFGFPLAVSGNDLYVNVFKPNNKLRGGFGYIFRKSNLVWRGTKLLPYPRSLKPMAWGFGEAMSGDWLVVGSPLVRSGKDYYGGAIYIFTFVRQHWREVGVLLAPKLSLFKPIAFSPWIANMLALSNRWLVVGMRNDLTSMGLAYFIHLGPSRFIRTEKRKNPIICRSTAKIIFSNGPSYQVQYKRAGILGLAVRLSLQTEVICAAHGC